MGCVYASRAVEAGVVEAVCDWDPEMGGDGLDGVGLPCVVWD
jgi:hypothetical protein